MISIYDRRKLEDSIITKFAKALGVGPQLIKELEEDPVTVIIENNHDNEKLNKAYHTEEIVQSVQFERRDYRTF